MRTQALFVHSHERGGAPKARRRRRAMELALAAVALEAAALWARSGRLGGRVTVRCRDGHTFRTVWIPAVSVKSLRLGPWRLQRCPVGAHWSVVTPVRESTLTAAEREAARERADSPIP